MMDSGIGRRAEVIKAISLGESAVLIGRPYIYGLAVVGGKRNKDGNGNWWRRRKYRRLFMEENLDLQDAASFLERL